MSSGSTMWRILEARTTARPDNTFGLLAMLVAIAATALFCSLYFL